MFYKLARKNVTRSLKDYSVYFITLALGVSIFYIFNSLESQWAVQMLAQNAHYMVESILVFMNVFSVFVSVVLACLVLYANTFLIKRRKRELGTYYLLGLSTGKVSLLLVLETLLIGLFALVVGILLGVAFFYVDYEAPVDKLRVAYEGIVQASKHWDGEVQVMQVTDITERVLQLRCLASARSAGGAFDLRCEIREKLMAYMRDHCREALPRDRLEWPQGEAVARPPIPPAPVDPA